MKKSLMKFKWLALMVSVVLAAAVIFISSCVKGPFSAANHQIHDLQMLI